ncbi:transglycosylase domain-containing protein [Cohnella terricola]|uniref:PBP1A family penicillin-binding protein n=1 Tax=Cohnella terricola TaxID=1289167 RepID=A0A559JR04_9BACL|nr:PBP1A family penicillin-binding protein [Cohnella terricola]TVY02311.1 PBP1A family penicillin-binding protein [Cohnella terricola]
MNHPEVPIPSGQTTRNTKKAKGGKGKGKGPRKGRKKAALIWLFFILLFAAVIAVVGYLLVILNGQRILSANENKLNLDQASIVVDRNGNEIAKLAMAGGNREVVPVNEIPKLLQDAFVATEDKRFYEHGGVDFLGIGRALVKDVIARSAVEGASTITQQLAKNLFLNADKTVFRKGTEASIALALEQQKSKQEILELYLNRIYFGKGQYGIKTAAKYYFDVTDLNELKIWQIATLAGMPKAPSVYNPINNPEKSMDRRGVVLKLMYDQGLITEKEKDEAAKHVYKPSKSSKADDKYISFIDYVLDEAQERTGLSEEELRSAGYKITTTIDTKAQNAMEKEFANNDRFEKSVDEQKVQGAMVIMDQHDGSLIAMVGGRDYETQGWNRVTKQRQPGSSFKPIMDYGPAIETGKYFPWSTVQDVKKCFGNYCPSNSNRNKYLGDIPMSQAIKESRNVSAVWLLNEIGIGKGLAFADNLGIKLDKEDRNLAVALGGLTRGVTPLQMVRAYGAFANGGKLQDPHSIVAIADNKNKVIYEFKSNAKQVMKENTSFYVTELLKGVVQKGGTGTRAAISGREVVGKTGTTQAGIPDYKTSKNRDVWFVGYTPELTAAVWMGYDKTDKTHLLDGSSGQAASMFSAVMSKVLENYKKQSFPVPSGLQEDEKVGAVTGLMAAYMPESVSVELKWNPVEGDNVTYKVYRKEAGEPDFRKVAEVSDPAYDDLALLPDQTFTYYVTAYQASSNQESAPSEKVTVTITSGMDNTPPPDENDGNTPPDESGEPSGPPIDINIPGESPSPPSEGESPIPSDNPDSWQPPGENLNSVQGDVPLQ